MASKAKMSADEDNAPASAVMPKAWKVEAVIAALVGQPIGAAVFYAVRTRLLTHDVPGLELITVLGHSGLLFVITCPGYIVALVKLRAVHEAHQQQLNRTFAVAGALTALIWFVAEELVQSLPLYFGAIGLALICFTAFTALAVPILLIHFGRCTHLFVRHYADDECPVCGYSLINITTDRCPECGEPVYSTSTDKPVR